MNLLNEASHLRRLGASLSLALLAGCSVLPETPAINVHTLPTNHPAAASAPAVDWSLRVTTPQAGASLSSARIVVLPEPTRVSVYQGARWSDPAPTLLRDRLIEAFRRDGRLPAVVSDQNGLVADFELDGDLGAFQSEYTGAQVEVVLRYDARLVRPSNSRILAAQRFEIREPATDVQMPAVISAFGRAADRLSAEVTEWTMHQAQRNAQR